MTYLQFLARSQRAQRAYIREERRRMEKARKLFERYAKAMHQLGLHPLGRMEIVDRWDELNRMERDVPTDYGDGPAMQGAYRLHLANQRCAAA